MATDPPNGPALLRRLEALNATLTRNGVQPPLDLTAAEALEVDDLDAAVQLTGRYLVRVLGVLGEQ